MVDEASTSDIEGDSRPRPVRAFLSLLVGLYWLSVAFIFAPYYNWRFAHDHGFGVWVLGGEFVPTLKALVWPYFVWDGVDRSSRRKEAEAYAIQIAGCTSDLTKLKGKLGEAITRFDERSNILGIDAGRAYFDPIARDVSIAIHASLDRSIEIRPPKFMESFHLKYLQGSREMVAKLDVLLDAVSRRDHERVLTLEKQMQELQERNEQELSSELKRLGIE